jgi:hypothetical protein
MVPNVVISDETSEQTTRTQKGLVVVLSETCVTNVVARSAISQATASRCLTKRPLRRPFYRPLVRRP